MHIIDTATSLVTRYGYDITWTNSENRKAIGQVQNPNYEKDNLFDAELPGHTITKPSNKHPAMLGIGSVHTATSSVYHLLCDNYQDIKCPTVCWECGRYTHRMYYQFMADQQLIPPQYFKKRATYDNTQKTTNKQTNK